jgi:8-oxo-dGTP pyrophosphatase MutT (NUDIX family)
VRETLEEAGVDVILKGILRVENSMGNDGGRQRVIFYAEPKDPNQTPKQTPDKESLGAAWLSLEELKAKKNISPPEGLRGEELLDWGTYIESGGTIYPLDVFATELTPVPDVTL